MLTNLLQVFKLFSSVCSEYNDYSIPYFKFPYLCIIIFRYRRYFGVIVTHYTSAVYSARRTEMVEVLGLTLFYLDRDRPVEIHSPFSDLPLQVIILTLLSLF